MGFSLRPYQSQAVAATIRDLAAGNKVVANIMPTGSGKTEAMSITIDEYLKTKPECSALVLSHLSLLTEQSLKRFRSRIPQRTVSVMQGQRKPNPMGHVTISTMQTSRSAVHIEALKETMVRKVGLLIVDETHYLPNTSYEIIRSYFPDIPIVGYTATPFRDKRLMTNYFDKISFTISLQELIDQKYLVPPMLRAFASQISEELTHEEAMQVVTLHQMYERGKKGIVYMRTIEQAKFICTLFESVGIKARAVTAEVTGSVREAIFDSYTGGDTEVLATVDVLTAGFDAPQVEAIYMPFGTKSPTQYLQRIGRGLRPSEGKESCRIYMPGDAPKVVKKAYERINSLVLNAGRSRGSLDRFTEELELTFFDKSDETYHWTVEVVKCVEKMQKLGMGVFAQMLNEKKFPAHFMQSITELIKRLPDKKKSIPHGDKPATDGQRSMLFEYGFDSKTLSMMNRGEASMMISTIFNRENDPHNKSREFVVTEGHFKGRHVSELPFKYRKRVLEDRPDSPVALLINKWNERKKRA